ncbi:MAG: hypothetical protein ABIO70_06100 [Pseudomonadota bacterium]
MSERLKVIEYEGHYYVQRETTLYAEPTATRLWWLVAGIRFGPYATTVDRDRLLTETPQGRSGTVGPDYRVGSNVEIYLPQGGDTVACRRWEAHVPPPNKARVVMEKWNAERGDVYWHLGRWVKEMARSEKSVPVDFDKLKWEEKEV